MTEHRITDFVDQKAIDRLKELRDEMLAVKQAYAEIASELSKGIASPAKNFGDIEKLVQTLAAAQGKAAAATETLSANLSRQKKAVTETAAAIQKDIEGQSRLNASQQEAYAANDKVKAILEKINGTYENQVKNLIRTNQQIEANKNAFKENDAALKAGTATAEEHAQAQLRLTMEARQLAQEKQNLTTLLKNEERAMQTTEGSYSHLSQQLELMKKAYKSMTEEEKKSDVGKELDSSITTLDAHLKDLAAGMGEYQRSVGNYALAQGSVKKELKDVVLELANLKLAYGQMSQSERETAEGRELADHINELTEKAGSLRDAISDANAAVGNAASDTRGFDQIASGVQLLIDGFGAATGAAQMLGLSEDDLIEVQANLQSAIAASNALSSIQATLQKESALMQGIYAIQTKAAAMAENARTAAVGKGAAATKAATLAQRAFNLVAKANPYVLLAAAVMTVVGALYAFSKGSKATRQEEEQRQKQMEEARQQQEEFKRTVVESAGAQIAMYLQMKRQWESLRTEMEKNKFIDDTKDKWKTLGKEISNVNDMEKIFKDGTSGIVDAILKRAMIDAYKSRITKIGEEVADAIESNSGKNVKYRPLRGVTPGKTAVSGSGQGGSFSFGDLTPQELAAVKDQLTWHNYSMGSGGYNTITQAGIDKINQLRNDAALAEAQRKRDKAMDDGLAKIDEYQKQIEAWTDDVNNIMGSLPGENAGDGGGTGEGAGSATASASLLPDAKNEEELAEVILKIRQQSVNDRLQLEKEGSQEWLELKKEAIGIAEQAQLGAAAKARGAALKDVEESAAQNLITEEQKAQMLVGIETDYQSQVKAIRDKAAADLEEAEGEVSAKRIEALSLAAAQEQSLIDRNYQQSLLKLKQRYQNELASAGSNAQAKAKAEEAYLKEQAELAEQYAINTASAHVQSLEEILKAEELTAADRADIEKRLAQAKADLSDKAADAAIAAMKREGEAEEEEANKSKQRYKERTEAAAKWLQQISSGLNAINDLASAVFDSKIEKIEQEQEVQDEAAEQEQERITELVQKKVITEEEGEARKRAASAKTAKETEKLEKKKAQLQQKQAVWEKANSLAQTAISTALAIMQTVAQMGMPAAIPMIAVTAALGAIQTAAILATPIPKYAKGTDCHKGGLAIVGDAGKKEVITFREKMFITPDVPTIVDIPRGAQVLPDAEKAIAGIGDMTVPPNSLARIAEAGAGSSYNFGNIEKRIERTNSLIGGLSEQLRQLAVLTHRDSYRSQHEAYKNSKL